LKEFINSYKQDHPKLQVKPYSQPPSVTFYADDGAIIEKVMIEKSDSLTKLRQMLHKRGL